MVRECGDCSECCSGKLIGNAYGNEFHPKRPCVFLVDCKCTIYKTRPDVCRKFQCGWLQGILPIEMKPNECGYMVSVEVKNNKQFLKVITDKELDDVAIQFFDNWCKENNTYYEVVNVAKTI